LKLDDGTMFGKKYTIRPMETSGPGAVPELLWSKRVVKAPEAPLEGRRPEDGPLTEMEKFNQYRGEINRFVWRFGEKHGLDTDSRKPFFISDPSDQSLTKGIAWNSKLVEPVDHGLGDRIKNAWRVLKSELGYASNADVLRELSDVSPKQYFEQLKFEWLSTPDRHTVRFTVNRRGDNASVKFTEDRMRAGGVKAPPAGGGLEASEGSPRVVRNPLSTEAIADHLQKRHGISPDNKAVQIVDRPEWEALGQYNPQTRKIEINRARISSTEDVDWVWDHETAHLFDIENPGAVAAIRKAVTAAEWNKIVSEVQRAGYADSVQVREQDARVVQTLIRNCFWRARAYSALRG